MTGPGNPVRGTRAAKFRSWMWWDRLYCWRWGTSDVRFPQVLRRVMRPKKNRERKKIHSDFRVARLTCTEGQGNPERGTATWPSRPSLCGSSWSRRSSGTWASRCRSALIIPFIIGNLYARATNGHPEGLAFARGDGVVVSTCTGGRGTPVPGTSGPGSLRWTSGNRAHRPLTESLGAHYPPALKSTPFLCLYSLDSLIILIQSKSLFALAKR